MITELSAQNFKSWQDTDALQFAPLTGFFGANNSGKTSILQLLLLLKQTTEQPVQPLREDVGYGLSPWEFDYGEMLYFGDEKSLVNLVDFDTVIHRHSNSRLHILLRWKLPEQIEFRGTPVNSLSFSTEIYKKYDEPMLDNFHYIAGEHNLVIRWTAQGYRLEHNTTDAKPLRCYGITNPVGGLEEFSPLQEAFEDLFDYLHYLGPRRVDPRHDYSWAESHPEDIGRRGEKMISALLSSRVQNRSIDERIMNWLRELDLIYSYTINSISDTEQDYELLVRQYKDGPEVGLTDVGFGVSQVLPLIAQCYYAPEGSILILENPEAHLHPKAQSELADVFIDVVKNRNVQIILESHSEHLLLRLMRRIAEEEISADQTAFHFCEIKDGNSRAEQLKVDEYGNISNWPQNFFGDDMGDLAEKTKAEMKRRKANK